MGAPRPQTPSQEQRPWTLSVGASRTRYEAGDTPIARKHPGQLRNDSRSPHGLRMWKGENRQTCGKQNE